MKYDSKTITTYKSLNEIYDKILDAAQSLRGSVERNDGAFFSGSSSRMSLSVVGKNSILGGPRSWRVDVIAEDHGYTCSVELVAVGDITRAKIASGFDMYNGISSGYYELKDSIQRRDKIASYL